MRIIEIIIKTFLLGTITTLIISGCEQDQTQTAVARKISPAETIREKLINHDNYVMVVAHRGDWRNAPENSIKAIKRCIKMGVDIVEIDVRKTRDGQLVVIHDSSLDRTTTGSGNVSDWTLDSIKTLYLKNGLGRATTHRIPTLEEAMLAAKDSIMVNLDKCYDYFPEAFSILQKTGTVHQAIMKGSRPLDQVKTDFGQYLDQVIFMPIIRLTDPGARNLINEYKDGLDPVAIEFSSITNDTAKVFADIKLIRSSGTRIWINALWPSLNAGHDDDAAVEDPEGNYGWILDKGANIIQTDRPAYLLDYLNGKGLR